MGEKKIKYYYFLLFKILLFMAGIISIKNQSWTNLILVIITFFLIYMNKILKLRKKKSFPNKIEIFILVLIYITIFIETTTLIKISDLWFRISFYLLISFIIGTIGFLLIYILNNDENANLKLNPLFVSLFAFTFSITIATLWQIFRYSMNYMFQINIQNFNTSDSLGFITVTTLGAGIVSIIGYIYLKTDEDKNFIRNTFKFLGINKDSQKKKQIQIIKLISKGESKNLEFKETLRYNIKKEGYDKRMGHSVLKTISAFLNTKGGTLLVGVSDDGQVRGIERDGFQNSDKFSLYFNNLFKKHIGNQFAPFMTYEILNINQTRNKSAITQQILKVSVKTSDKEVFLKDGDKEEFYIRTGPASVLVEGSKLIDYIKRRF